MKVNDLEEDLEEEKRQQALEERAKLSAMGTETNHDESQKHQQLEPSVRESFNFQASGEITIS